MPYKTKFFANPFHGKKRCANGKSCYIAAKRMCEESETSTERQVRREKHMSMSGENSKDVVLSLEHEVRREIF